MNKIVEVVLDIETIPNQNLKDFHHEIINRKLEGKIGDNKDEIKYCSINPEFSQIVCICCDINKGIFNFTDKNESDLLINFWDFIGEFNSQEIKLITFNGKKFDVPVILIRSAILKIQPLIKLTNKRYDTYKHYDCMEIISNFYQNQNILRLQEYAKIFGIENNDDSVGSDVYKLFQENKLDEIVNHCLEDIQTTKKLYKILSLYF